MKLPRPAASLAHVTGGFLLWSSCFVALYALLSLGCEAGWGGLLRAVLLATWAAHLAAIAALGAFQWRALRRDRASLLRVLALAASVAALFATAWIGWPVLALPPCIGGELALPPT